MVIRAMSLFVLLTALCGTMSADPITITNGRAAGSTVNGTLGTQVPLSDNGTTSISTYGSVVILFLASGGTPVCNSCLPIYQGPLVGTFVGTINDVQFGSSPFNFQQSDFFPGYQPSAVGFGFSLPHSPQGATFTGTVTVTLADGTPLAYTDFGGVVRINPTFSVAGTVVPPPPHILEPTTMLLLATGLAGIAAKLKRRQKQVP